MYYGVQSPLNYLTGAAWRCIASGTFVVGPSGRYYMNIAGSYRMLRVGPATLPAPQCYEAACNIRQPIQNRLQHVILFVERHLLEAIPFFKSEYIGTASGSS